MVVIYNPLINLYSCIVNMHIYNVFYGTEIEKAFIMKCYTHTKSNAV